MLNDPLARLNLPRQELLSPAAVAPPPIETAGVPDFPAVVPASSAASAPADPESAMPSAVALTGAAEPARVSKGSAEPWAAPLTPALSDLDRYRLEQDRELLRTIAYRRHFLNRED